MQRYENLILQLGRKYIRDEDELDDFLQDVFLQVYQSLCGFRGESQLSTWIYRIARNRLSKNAKLPRNLTIGNHQEFDALMGEKFPTERESHFELHFLKEEFQTKIRSLVAKLPTQYKTPIVLYYFENLSYKEISEQLNLKLNTLKSYLRRGKDIMKEWFHE